MTAAALTLRGELPDVGLLLLSQYAEERYLAELLAQGAEGVGYLLKDRVAEVEVLTRRSAGGEGGSVLDPDIVARMVGRRAEEGPLEDLRRVSVRSSS